MFISRAEKTEMQQAIRSLQARVRDLEIELTWTKNKLAGKRMAIVKTEEAPWGHKKDGTPAKRPGRPPVPMEVGS
jgi:hypothetical protein